MTDMATEFLKIQSTQQSPAAPKQPPRTETASDGESFSEKLENAINGDSKQVSAQEQPKDEAQQATGAEVNEEAAENGAMLMAEAMAAAGLAVILPTAQADQTQTPVVEAAATQEAALIEAASVISDAVPVEPVVPAAPAQGNSSAEPVQNITGQQASAAQTESVPVITVTPSESGASQTGQGFSEPESMLHGQTEFQKSVEIAQQLLRNTDENSSRLNAPKLDIEELQRKVDSKEYLNAGQSLQAAQSMTAERMEQPQQASAAARQPQIDSRDVFAQVKAAADSHVAQGDSDFTIKLRPEGLGEITVKLVAEDGRITLSLSANDVNVQKLLGSEINSLRDVMRPYNVEVSEVVSSSNETAMADLQQQLQQHSQQFPGRQRQRFTAAAAAPGVDDGDVAIEEKPAGPASALDAYI